MSENAIVRGHTRCIDVDQEAVRLAKAAPLLLEALKEAREAMIGQKLIEGKLSGPEILKTPIIARIDSAIAAATTRDK